MQKNKSALQVLAIGIGVVTTAWVVGRTAMMLATGAQMALNFALTANPIGAVIIAVAALTAGIIYAYRHSQTFRNILNGLWSDMKSAARWLETGFVKAFKVVFTAVKLYLWPMIEAVKAVVAGINLLKHLTGGKAMTPKQRANSVTPSGGRFGPVTGSSHASALHNQVKSLSTIGTRQTDVNGQSTSSPVGSCGPQVIELHHQTKIGARVLAETVTRYALRANALAGVYTAVS